VEFVKHHEGIQTTVEHFKEKIKEFRIIDPNFSEGNLKSMLKDMKKNLMPVHCQPFLPKKIDELLVGLKLDSNQVCDSLITHFKKVDKNKCDCDECEKNNESWITIKKLFNQNYNRYVDELIKKCRTPKSGVLNEAMQNFSLVDRVLRSATQTRNAAVIITPSKSSSPRKRKRTVSLNEDVKRQSKEKLEDCDEDIPELISKLDDIFVPKIRSSLLDSDSIFKELLLSNKQILKALRTIKIPSRNENEMIKGVQNMLETFEEMANAQIKDQKSIYNLIKEELQNRLEKLDDVKK
jgi:hypothetical protein